MHVRHLALTDFRSWERVELDLDAGRTAFVGPNGFGKTNLIEALWYSSTLGSHRVASDAPLIRAGADRAVVSTIVVSDGRELARFVGPGARWRATRYLKRAVEALSNPLAPRPSF